MSYNLRGQESWENLLGSGGRTPPPAAVIGSGQNNSPTDEPRPSGSSSGTIDVVQGQLVGSSGAERMSPRTRRISGSSDVTTPFQVGLEMPMTESPSHETTALLLNADVDTKDIIIHRRGNEGRQPLFNRPELIEDFKIRQITEDGQITSIDPGNVIDLLKSSVAILKKHGLPVPTVTSTRSSSRASVRSRHRDGEGRQEGHRRGQKRALSHDRHQSRKCRRSSSNRGQKRTLSHERHESRKCHRSLCKRGKERKERKERKDDRNLVGVYRHDNHGTLNASHSYSSEKMNRQSPQSQNRQNPASSSRPSGSSSSRSSNGEKSPKRLRPTEPREQQRHNRPLSQPQIPSHRPMPPEVRPRTNTQCNNWKRGHFYSGPSLSRANSQRHRPPIVYQAKEQCPKFTIERLNGYIVNIIRNEGFEYMQQGESGPDRHLGQGGGWSYARSYKHHFY